MDEPLLPYVLWDSAVERAVIAAERDRADAIVRSMTLRDAVRHFAALRLGRPSPLLARIEGRGE